jgi:hypothetical protein
MPLDLKPGGGPEEGNIKFVDIGISRMFTKWGPTNLPRKKIKNSKYFSAHFTKGS